MRACLPACTARALAALPARCCVVCQLLQGKKSRAQFNNWLCYELTGGCRSKPPPLPKVGDLQGILVRHVRAAARSPVCSCHERCACWQASCCSCVRAGCACLQDRTPGPPFEPKQEGDQNLDAMLGGLAVGAAAAGRHVLHSLLSSCH